jgi:hypothetical protein
MTLEALFQAVFLGPDTLMHGRIAMIQQKVHMPAPHDVGILDALIALDGRRNVRPGDSAAIIGQCRRRETQRQQGRNGVEEVD